MIHSMAKSEEDDEHIACSESLDLKSKEKHTYYS